VGDYSAAELVGGTFNAQAEQSTSWACQQVGLAGKGYDDDDVPGLVRGDLLRDEEASGWVILLFLSAEECLRWNELLVVMTKSWADWTKSALITISLLMQQLF
jgi:hypothetical protein